MSATSPTELEKQSGQPEKQVEESEQLKDRLLRADFSKLKEVAEIGSKFLFAIVGVCYLAGLLILNLNLQTYGVSHIGFIQLDYVIVGALWLILSLFEYLLTSEILHRERENWKRLRGKKEAPVLVAFLIKVPLWSLFNIAGYLVFNLSVVSYFTGQWGKYPNKHTWIAIAGLALGIIQYKIFAGNIKEFYGWLPKTKMGANILMRSANISHVVYYALPILIGLNSYATLTYPSLKAAYGGGKKQKIILISKLDQVSTFNALGFKLENEQRKIGPIEMVFEGSDFFIVTPPSDVDPKNEIKAVRIKKEMVDAAFYISNE